MRKVFAICMTVACILAMCGCNRQMIDLTYKYDKAVIALPDGSVVSGEVERWTDFEDGDQLQIVVDGKTYLVHSSDCVLIAG